MCASEWRACFCCVQLATVPWQLKPLRAIRLATPARVACRSGAAAQPLPCIHEGCAVSCCSPALQQAGASRGEGWTLRLLRQRLPSERLLQQRLVCVCGEGVWGMGGGVWVVGGGTMTQTDLLKRDFPALAHTSQRAPSPMANGPRRMGASGPCAIAGSSVSCAASECTNPIHSCCSS